MKKNRNEMSKEEAEREAKRIFKEEARKAGYYQFSKDPEIDREMNEFFEKVGGLIAQLGIEVVKKAIQFSVQKLRLKGNKTVGGGSVAEEVQCVCKTQQGREYTKSQSFPFHRFRAITCASFRLQIRNSVSTTYDHNVATVVRIEAKGIKRGI